MCVCVCVCVCVREPSARHLRVHTRHTHAPRARQVPVVAPCCALLRLIAVLIAPYCDLCRPAALDPGVALLRLIAPCCGLLRLVAPCSMLLRLVAPCCFSERAGCRRHDTGPARPVLGRTAARGPRLSGRVCFSPCCALVAPLCVSHLAAPAGRAGRSRAAAPRAICRAGPGPARPRPARPGFAAEARGLASATARDKRNEARSDAIRRPKSE